MATANDLLAQAIAETKHLHTNEIFLVRDYLKAMNGTEYQEVTDCYWGLCS